MTRKRVEGRILKCVLAKFTIKIQDKVKSVDMLTK